MGRILKLMVILSVLLGMVGAVVPAYSQEKTEKQSVSAEVVSVDLKKSEIVIKILKDPITKTYENKTIPVLPETEILKADARLKLADLKAGDKVKVEYTTAVLGKWKVESISVETTEALPKP